METDQTGKRKGARMPDGIFGGGGCGSGSPLPVLPGDDIGTIDAATRYLTHKGYSIVPVRCDKGDAGLHTGGDLAICYLRRELAFAKDAAQDASRLKSEFLSNMYHEIRTPTNGIVGMIDLVLEEGVTERQSELLGLARESALRMTATVEEILELSVLATEKIHGLPESVSLAGLIDELCASAETICNKKNLTFVSEIAPSIPEIITTDRKKLMRILDILIGNAVKFTDKGGIVLMVDLADDLGSIVFDVGDTGCGIPGDHLGRIFDTFMQGDGSRTRKHDGLGAGLSIAKKLSDIIGSRLSVKSMCGNGTTFTLRLPIKYEHQSC